MDVGYAYRYSVANIHVQHCYSRSKSTRTTCPSAAGEIRSVTVHGDPKSWVQQIINHYADSVNEILHIGERGQPADGEWCELAEFLVSENKEEIQKEFEMPLLTENIRLSLRDLFRPKGLHGWMYPTNPGNDSCLPVLPSDSHPTRANSTLLLLPYEKEKSSGLDTTVIVKHTPNKHVLHEGRSG